MSLKISNKKKYPTELSDKSWEVISELLPKPKKKQDEVGRRPLEGREVLNGIFSILRSGCSWRMLPNDYPAWESVYGRFAAVIF